MKGECTDFALVRPQGWLFREGLCIEKMDAVVGASEGKEALILGDCDRLELKTAGC